MCIAKTAYLAKANILSLHVCVKIERGIYLTCKLCLDVDVKHMRSSALSTSTGAC